MKVFKIGDRVRLNPCESYRFILRIFPKNTIRWTYTNMYRQDQLAKVIRIEEDICYVIPPLQWLCHLTNECGLSCPEYLSCCQPFTTVSLRKAKSHE